MKHCINEKKFYKISLIFFLLLLLFGCTIALNMSRKEKKQLDADTNQSDTGKIIICISEDEVWNAYDETNNIILKDGGLSVIDYEEREKKILYVNQENKIVELEMDTGQKNTILLPLISESTGENSKEIQNPKKCRIHMNGQKKEIYILLMQTKRETGC